MSCAANIRDIQRVKGLAGDGTAAGNCAGGKILDILFQVNASEEENKSDLDVANAEAFLAELETLAGARDVAGNSENSKKAKNGY